MYFLSLCLELSLCLCAKSNGLSSEGKTAGKGSRMKSFSDQIKDQSIECRSKQSGIDRQSQAGWAGVN